MKVTGINHLTFAVSVLERSILFYRDLLGCSLRARWDGGAYLEAGDVWICLIEQAEFQPLGEQNYSHVAFSVSADSIRELEARIETATAIWQRDKSEGDSVYFLDPDGRKLEIHVGSLDSRLAHYRAHPEKGVKIFE